MRMLLSLAVAAAMTVSAFARADDPKPQDTPDLQPAYEQLWQHVTDSYAGKLPADWANQRTRFTGKLDSAGVTRGAASLAFSTAGDPQLRVLSEVQVEEYLSRIGGGYIGIGVRYKELPDKSVAIDLVLPGSPAEKAGLREGDLLTKVNGHDAKGGGLFWIHNQTGTGKLGDEISITVARGEESIPVVMKRSVVESWGRYLTGAWQNFDGPDGKGITTVRVINLDWVNLVKWVDDHGKLSAFPGTILDLRGASGNNPEIAARLVARFIKSGDALRFTRKEGGKDTLVRYIVADYRGKNTLFVFANNEIKPVETLDNQALDTKVVVLVDNQTSGTAEALARTLQQLGRAKVVGGTTSGVSRATVTTKVKVGDKEVYVQVPAVTLLDADGKPVGAVRPDRHLWSQDAVQTAKDELAGRQWYNNVEFISAVMIFGLFGFILFLARRYANRAGRETEETRLAARVLLVALAVVFTCWLVYSAWRPVAARLGEGTMTDSDKAAARLIHVLKTDPEARESYLQRSGIPHGPNDAKVDPWQAQKDETIADAEIEAACRIVTAMTHGDLEAFRTIIAGYKGKPYARAQVAEALNHAFRACGLQYYILAHDRWFHLDMSGLEDGTFELVFSALAEEAPEAMLMKESKEHQGQYGTDRTDLANAEQVLRSVRLKMIYKLLYDQQLPGDK